MTGNCVRISGRIDCVVSNIEVFLRASLVLQEISVQRARDEVHEASANPINL